MQLLKETLLVNIDLTGLRLPGNNLDNQCIALILSSLSLPNAPLVFQLDFSNNSALTWMCCYPLAEAIGGEAQEVDVTIVRPPSPSKNSRDTSSLLDKASMASVKADASPFTGSPNVIHKLGSLCRLLLDGIKLQDKGAAVLAKALAKNVTLKVSLISPFLSCL